ncbi:MAG TPA: hypothetical protein VF653_12425 [Methylomirabilota bacterium]
MKEEGGGETAVAEPQAAPSAPAAPATTQQARDEQGRFAKQQEAERDAAEDKLLDDLAAKHGMTLTGGVKPREQSPRPEDGEERGQRAATKKDEEREEADSEEGTESESPKAIEADEEAEEPEDEQEYESALKALRFDGYTKKDIEALGRANVLRIGAKRAKSQAELQHKLNERAELLNQQKSSARTEGDTAEPSQPAKQSAQLADLRKKAADEYGEDFATLLDEYVQAASGSRENGNGAHDRTIAMLSDTVEGLLIERARSELVDRFPKLADKSVLAKVKQKMEQLVAGGGYSDVGELMFDSASIVLGHEQASTEKAKPRTKLSSQPHAPGRQVQRKPLTDEERDDIYLQARFDGKSKEEAERLIDR